MMKITGKIKRKGKQVKENANVNRVSGEATLERKSAALSQPELIPKHVDTLKGKSKENEKLASTIFFDELDN